MTVDYVLKRSEEGAVYLVGNREPLADFALTQLGHHFLLNHAGQQKLAVQRDLLVLAEASCLEALGVVREHFRHGTRR